MRARLLLWCGNLLAGVVTARGPEREARTGEWWPQGIASSFLFWLAGNGLRPRAVEREPANPNGRAGGDMRKSYFVGCLLPIWKSAWPRRFGGEDRAASVRGLGIIRVGRGGERLR